MDEKIESNYLEALGITEGEARVYSALLELGSASALEIARKSLLQKSTAYFCLERLVRKGLASQINRGKTRVFQPAPLSTAISMVEERKNELESVRKKLAQLSKKISTTANNSFDAKVFLGWNGVRTAFEGFFEPFEKEDYLVFSVTIPEAILPRFRRLIRKVHQSRVSKGIKSRLLVSDELKKTIGKDRQSERFTKVKYVPQGFATPSVVNVYGDKTLVIVWAEEPCALLLKSQAASKNFRNYFEVLWQTSAIQ